MENISIKQQSTSLTLHVTDINKKKLDKGFKYIERQTGEGTAKKKLSEIIVNKSFIKYASWLLKPNLKRGLITRKWEGWSMIDIVFIVLCNWIAINGKFCWRCWQVDHRCVFLTKRRYWQLNHTSIPQDYIHYSSKSSVYFIGLSNDNGITVLYASELSHLLKVWDCFYLLCK